MHLELSTIERTRLAAAMRKARSARLLRRLQAVRLAAEGRAAREIATVVPAARMALRWLISPWRTEGASFSVDAARLEVRDQRILPYDAGSFIFTWPLDDFVAVRPLIG